MENFSSRSAAERALQSFRPLVWGESSARQSLALSPGGSLNPVLKPAVPDFSPDPDEELELNLMLWSRGLGSLVVTSTWMLKVDLASSFG